MNLSGPLLLLFLTAACTVSGQKQSRGVLKFGTMIWCAQPGVNPLKYNGYGCYCGFGGYGTPVDQLDRCCKVHDDCYTAIKRNPQCKGFFNLPYVVSYKYTCSRRQPICSASNKYCQRAACECDRRAALCFARSTYNPKYKNWNNKRNCKK